MTLLRAGFGAAAADARRHPASRRSPTHPDAPALDNGAEVLTYAEFAEAAERASRRRSTRCGVGRGTGSASASASGTVDLYVAIMGVLVAGRRVRPGRRRRPGRARPDGLRRGRRRRGHRRRPRRSRTADRPSARGREPPSLDRRRLDHLHLGLDRHAEGRRRHRTGRPPAFVDAEARLFLQDAPLGPGDRVMAGLSVAFDASCEEMWLAWAHGACLVPAPRSLVRSGDGPRARGWSPTTSPWSRRCRRWWRCGRRRRWTTSGC